VTPEEVSAAIDGIKAELDRVDILVEESKVLCGAALAVAADDPLGQMRAEHAFHVELLELLSRRVQCMARGIDLWERVAPVDG